jgi:predicted nucleic acid-binding Zn ribbon protein
MYDRDIRDHDIWLEPCDHKTRTIQCQSKNNVDNNQLRILGRFEAMPVYVYRNLNTNETFEIEQRITEAALTHHPETGDPVKRLIQPVGIAFKGSGFYVTDSRSGASKSSSANTSSDSSAAPDSKADSKAESKPDSKTDSKADSKTDSSSKTSSSSTASTSST